MTIARFGTRQGEIVIRGCRCVSMTMGTRLVEINEGYILGGLLHT